MLTDYAANMDSIQTVPKHNLGSLIAALSSERMEEVNQAAAFALGLDVPTSGCEFREAVSLPGQRPAEVEDTLTAFG